ncbi:MAG: GNAT family N-acetyltransferase, partial [Chitinophagaceae bacterium]|nr:GNAT family N-acetyltransferase [Chitinophagaceae bacterium]
MQIRPATLHDVGTIQLLAARTWPMSARQVGYMLNSMYAADVLTEQMQNGHRFWLAEDEQGLPIGFAGASAAAPPDWKLHKLYVLPFIQTKGVGKALLQVAADTARQAGAAGLLLNVNRANKA